MPRSFLHQAMSAALREDFRAFIPRAFTTVNPGIAFLPNWHLDLTGEYLMAAARGDITRLVVTMPPRSLKSVLVSVAWPAWLLARNPATRILAASYSAALSQKHAGDCRLIVQSTWYRALFPTTRIAPGQNEKHKFITTRRGFRLATSVGGTVTGEGGDVLIIDDPLSAWQAMSATDRANANAWFDQVFSTRLDNKQRGVMVLVMQRLHTDDLAAHLLRKGGWEHLNLPAIAERVMQHDFGRMRVMRFPGHILHAAREGEAELRQARRELGAAAFSAQYQQTPLSDAGAMIRPHWLRRYDTLPDAELVVQSWDTGIKTGAQHDPSACVTLLVAGGAVYVVEVLVERLAYPELRRAIGMQAEIYHPHAILVEDKASGQQLMQERGQVSGVRCQEEGGQNTDSLLPPDPWPLIPVVPRGSKETRLRDVLPMLEAGVLHLPRAAHWLSVFEAELLGFPHTAHDDQLDALVQALLWLRERERREPRVRRV